MYHCIPKSNQPTWLFTTFYRAICNHNPTAVRFKPLGFQTIAQPIKQSNQLIYTVIRRIRIPTPTAQSAGLGAQNIPIQSAGNTDSNYDLNLKCHIIFELDQQQIARSIRYEGKVC